MTALPERKTGNAYEVRITADDGNPELVRWVKSQIQELETQAIAKEPETPSLKRKSAATPASSSQKAPTSAARPTSTEGETECTVAWKSAGKANGLMRRVYDDMRENEHAEDFKRGNEVAIARWVWRRCKNSRSDGRLKCSVGYGKNEEDAVQKIAAQIRNLPIAQSVGTVLAKKDSVMSRQTWTAAATRHMRPMMMPTMRSRSDECSMSFPGVGTADVQGAARAVRRSPPVGVSASTSGHISVGAHQRCGGPTPTRVRERVCERALLCSL